MEIFKRTASKWSTLNLMMALLMLTLNSCDETLDAPEPATAMEQALVENLWQMDRIQINESWQKFVSDGFEPVAQVQRRFLPWYYFDYNSDHTYDFRTDLERTSLGFEENYQPGYGFWDLDEEQNLLIHNKGMPYETHYRIIQLNDTSFIREYDRIIYQSNDTWPVGSLVVYRDHLVKRTRACC